MKSKAFLFSFLLFLLPLSVWSKSIDFTIFPYTGISYGCNYEMLYASLGKEKEVSRLEWKIEPLWTVGADISLETRHFLFTLGTEYALPLECGQMLDSDYDNFSDLKFCYSVSELKPKLTLHSHLDILYNFKIAESFSFMPEVSLYYFYDNYEARNGYGWYGQETKTHPLVAWDDPRAKFYDKGGLNGVDFYRHSLMTFAGMNFLISIRRLELNLKMLLSPYSYYYTMDIHLSKKRDYHLKEIQEAFFNQQFFECDILYKINDNLKIHLKGSQLCGNTVRGTFSNDFLSEKMQRSEQKSGSRLTQTSLKAGIDISF